MTPSEGIAPSGARDWPWGPQWTRRTALPQMHEHGKHTNTGPDDETQLRGRRRLSERWQSDTRNDAGTRVRNTQQREHTKRTSYTAARSGRRRRAGARRRAYRRRCTHWRRHHLDLLDRLTGSAVIVWWGMQFASPRFAAKFTLLLRGSVDNPPLSPPLAVVPRLSPARERHQSDDDSGSAGSPRGLRGLSPAASWRGRAAPP